MQLAEDGLNHALCIGGLVRAACNTYNAVDEGLQVAALVSDLVESLTESVSELPGLESADVECPETRKHVVEGDVALVEHLLHYGRNLGSSIIECLPSVQVGAFHPNVFSEVALGTLLGLVGHGGVSPAVQPLLLWQHQPLIELGRVVTIGDVSPEAQCLLLKTYERR